MKENLKDVFNGMDGYEILEKLKKAKLITDRDLYEELFDPDDESGIKETLSMALQRTYEKYKTEDSKRYQIVNAHFPPFKDLYKILDEWYSCDDYELMECVDKSSMIDYLENTYEMEAHDSEVRSTYHHSVMKEIVETIYCAKIDLSMALEDYTPDELWQLFCNVFRCGYYDKERFDKGLEEFLKKLKSSNYNLERK